MYSEQPSLDILIFRADFIHLPPSIRLFLATTLVSDIGGATTVYNSAARWPESSCAHIKHTKNRHAHNIFACSLSRNARKYELTSALQVLGNLPKKSQLKRQFTSTMFILSKQFLFYHFPWFPSYWKGPVLLPLEWNVKVPLKLDARVLKVLILKMYKQRAKMYENFKSAMSQKTLDNGLCSRIYPRILTDFGRLLGKSQQVYVIVAFHTQSWTCQ